MRHWQRTLSSVALGVALAFLASPASAQDGRISGLVQNAESGEPLVGAQIVVEGTGLGAVTQENGRYLILGVPAGTHTLTVEMLGFASSSEEIVLEAGERATVDFQVAPEAIALSEIVVTGVAGATARAKLPFEVSTVQAEDMPVPAVDIGTALQSKVAGVTIVRGSGQPGSSPDFLLRGATSLDASGRSQDPLFVIDGVIAQGGIADIGSLDIESVEILKGAAAASMYGSRAGNGVIQIRTARGSRLNDGSVRYTVRSEFGGSELAYTAPDLLPEHHEWRIENGQFVESDGSGTCDWFECESPAIAGTDAWDTYMVNEWPGQTFDQVARFFEGGGYLQNYVSASGRSGATNYHLSFSNLREEGVFRGWDGYERNNFRLNVDQAVLENVHVQGSAFYSRSMDDQWNAGGTLFNLTRMPAGVDLLGEDPNEPGELILVPDPTNTESPNPLYQLLTREREDVRSRFLGSVNVRYSPLEWLDFDANMSFDRRDRERQNLFPKGYRTINPSRSLNNGNLSHLADVREGINASVTATTRFDLTDDIANTTQLRYLYEDFDREQFSTGGFEFAVADVPTFGNINSETFSSNSLFRTVRSDGYFVISNFDIRDKYIVDGLVRNDGSSLFGADQRRQWYYRIGGTWRVGEEPWFDFPVFDEFKLRYSLGTAGGRPRFAAQYETYSVGGGRISPVNLGNRDLRPEHTTEHEAGLDAIFMDGRFQLGLTYANTRTEDQILQVPLPAMSGFGRQWRNAGTLQSNTYEATLDAQLVQTPDLSWSARLLFDRTRTEITELNIPAFTYGVGGQGLGNVFYAREGEELGNIYGMRFATSCSDLPEGVNCDAFVVDENGWLVWVGEGGSLADRGWGDVASFEVVEGRAVKWGTPFVVQCEDRSTGEMTLFCPVGNTLPDYNAALASTLTWNGFTLYGLVDAQQGFDIYNEPLEWAIFQRTAGIMDQADVPEDKRKPIGYFDDLYHGANGLAPDNHSVEDGSFVKIREVTLGYRFSPDVLNSVPGLRRLSGLGINVSGRNLYTFTNYRGYDPEVGEGGGDTGSSAIARVDGYQYPNFRTWSATVEINF